VLNFVVTCVTIIAGLIPGPQDGNTIAGQMYASEAPYGNAASSKIEKPPSGYKLFFVETIGRHGSRTAVGSAEEKSVLRLWKKAEKQGALTENGKNLKRDIERFQAVEKRVGYGELTSTGKAELAGLGRRTAENYNELFSRAQEDGDKVEFVTSPVKRTKESAQAMKGAIKHLFPDLKFGDAVSEKTLVIGANASPIGAQHIHRLKTKEIPNVKSSATNILLNIYQPQFVAGMKNPIRAALDMYLVYQRAPSLKAETDVTFEQYVDPGDAEVLGEEQSGEKFYRYGPGIRGEDSSYRGAKPLLRDFMKQLQKRVNGGKTAAVFRIAHGETLMPFTALTQLRSANQQEPKGGLFKETFNPWRGWKSGLLGGSVEWAAYRNDKGKVLLTLRFNEEPSRFSKACTPSSLDKHFYTLDEIKSCINSPGGFV
jgi:histidine phosphatase superfamily protein (branch 2)